MQSDRLCSLLRGRSGSVRYNERNCSQHDLQSTRVRIIQNQGTLYPELRVGDLRILILVHCRYHLVNFFVSYLPRKVHQDKPLVQRFSFNLYSPLLFLKYLFESCELLFRAGRGNQLCVCLCV